MDLVYCEQLKINSPEAMQGFFAKHIVSLGRKILNANTPATFIRCADQLYIMLSSYGLCVGAFRKFFTKPPEVEQGGTKKKEIRASEPKARYSYSWEEYPLWVRVLDFLANPYFQFACSLFLAILSFVFLLKVLFDNM
jgi:hypothetical protein